MGGGDLVRLLQAFILMSWDVIGGCDKRCDMILLLGEYRLRGQGESVVVQRAASVEKRAGGDGRLDQGGGSGCDTLSDYRYILADYFL